MLYRVLIGLLFVLTLIAIIAYARGYRFNIRDNSLSSNGLVAVTSAPRSAKVYVNDNLKGITDLNLYLEPETYTFTIVKDGYFPWKKTIKVYGEVVQSVDATLYPINSSLSPLTNIGVVKAIPFGTGEQKVLILSANTTLATTTTPIQTTPSPTATESDQKQGIFVYDSRSQTVSFFPSLSHVLDYNFLGSDIDPSKIEVLFSPKYDQAIIFYNAQYTEKSKLLKSQFDPNYEMPISFDTAHLINLNENNDSPLDVTISAVSIVDAWISQKGAEVDTLLSGYDKPLHQFIQDNTIIVDLSLDKMRILYEATASAKLGPVLKNPLIGSNQTPEVRDVKPNALYLYDVKEDRNYPILDANELGKQHTFPSFHPNGKDLVLNEQNSISIADYDGLNKQKVYSGPYDPNFYVVTTDGRVLILTNLNPALNQYSDLYAVGIR